MKKSLNRYTANLGGLALSLWLGVCWAHGSAQEDKSLSSLDDVVAQAMATWHVPGIALAIVRDGKILVARGFGYRDLERKLPVSADTVFPIGSVSKSFTSLVFGILDDEGKVDWDTPVRKYLPSFQLSDDFATDHATARDLFSHRTGLPGHDLVWISSDFSREDLVRRLRYLKFSKDFRSSFQYSNLMVVAMGYVEGKVADSSWEDLVRSRIFHPLDMSASNFSVRDVQEGADFAEPYELRKGVITRVPFKNVDAIGPAGGINSTIQDMSHYLVLQLGDGTYNGKAIVSPGNLRLTHTGQTAVGPLPEALAPSGIGPMIYAMGWVETTYRGHHMVWHNGGIDGFHSLLTMLPEDHVGIVILSNLGESMALEPIAYSVYDRLLGLPHVPWIDQYKDKAISVRAEQSTATAASRKVSIRQTGASASHPLEDFVGEYVNPGYGTVMITELNGVLQLALNQLPPRMFVHRRYDVFEMASDAGAPLDGMRGQFYLDKEGAIDRFTMPLEPSLPDDIAFTRKR